MDADEPIIRARDLMEPHVVTVAPSTRVLDAQRLLANAAIHGAPVVGKDATVQGMVSVLDLLRAVPDDRAEELTVADAMTRALVTVGPDAPVDVIARTMVQHRAHRVLVCDDGKLLGLISAFDVLRVFIPVPTIELLGGRSRHTGYRR